MREKRFIVLDTETADDVTHPLPYDVGWIVTNKKGEILESHSYVVYEIYCKEKELMQTAYYAEKIPQYEVDIEQGTRVIKSFWTIRKIFHECVARNNVTELYAYNMEFDKRALNNDTEKICQPWLKRFFPKNVEYKCIWRMACELLMTRPSFIKWAEKNRCESPKGNLYTSAEVCYRYITKDANFVESHTGLEDTLIENEILHYCLRQKKKYSAEPNSACWMWVQKYRKQMKKRGA